MMNKLKILRDLLRFCIHVNANQKSFGVSANALPKFESGQTLMGLMLMLKVHINMAVERGNSI